ncbi:fibronectin type III domain-containing protein [Flammeovirga aprica]|uniref:Uncharacterized protein n=1 Tax=Flammeovirga aprica JL-4 TaxID=694437 RepID=A0A7X9RZN9_9BACT|nr:fibronectin type III domain-containing protein [Flammeovirga aprica]NME71661.1 hypothetical protein [Flammeovirga aprica JL-4]
MKRNLVLLFTVILTTTFFSCSKQNDTVAPVVAKDPQNLKVEVLDRKAVVTWDAQAGESYSFQLAEDDKSSDIIFDRLEKKKKDSPIAIDSTENFINQGQVTFINIPVNQKFHFRVKAEIIDEKTDKVTSTSNYVNTNFYFEDNTKPAIPTTEVKSDQITFSSFNLDFPEGFNPANELDITLEVSKNEDLSNATTFRYYTLYGANANNLEPNTKYYYRVIPGDGNNNVRASEALSLTTHEISEIEMEKIRYRTEDGSHSYFTLEFDPKSPELVFLSAVHGTNLNAVSEVSTVSDFNLQNTISQAVRVPLQPAPPFAYFKTVDALGLKVYGRSYLKVGDHSKGKYSNTVSKEMPNAIASINNEVFEFFQVSQVNEKIILLKSKDEKAIKIQIELAEVLKEGDNKIVFDSSSNNKFSVIKDDVEYNSSQGNFTITLVKGGKSIGMKELIQSISLKSTDSNRLNLYYFGIGLRS